MCSCLVCLGGEFGFGLLLVFALIGFGVWGGVDLDLYFSVWLVLLIVWFGLAVLWDGWFGVCFSVLCFRVWFWVFGLGCLI